tara:strand:- start:116 stop:373 length:258 start_codon:yes stop_codon:yes gene_type:complete
MKTIFKPTHTVLICIIILLTLISIGKTKKINKLEQQIKNDVHLMHEYEQLDSLYLEIMALGAEVDSLRLRNENQEYFIEQLWNNQ